MEETSLKEIIQFFISKIGIVIALVIVSVIIGFMYVNYALTPMYHSSTTLILVSEQNNKANTSTLTTDVTLNQKLVTTYSEIVKSRSVLQKVIANLNLDIKVSDLSKQITVTAVNDTEIIKIQVSNKDNELAKSIAHETASIFMDEIKDIYNLSNISVIDEAELETEPYNISLIKQLGISGVIGLFLGIVVLMFIFYFDTSIKSSSEIEDKLGLTVIGNVTSVKRK